MYYTALAAFLKTASINPLLRSPHLETDRLLRILGVCLTWAFVATSGTRTTQSPPVVEDPGETKDEPIEEFTLLNGTSVLKLFPTNFVEYFRSMDEDQIVAYEILTQRTHVVYVFGPLEGGYIWMFKRGTEYTISYFTNADWSFARSRARSAGSVYPTIASQEQPQHYLQLSERPDSPPSLRERGTFFSLAR